MTARERTERAWLRGMERRTLRYAQGRRAMDEAESAFARLDVAKAAHWMREARRAMPELVTMSEEV